MRPDTPLTHEFVEYIPEKLEERTVYVSVEFATAVHRCCCGCGAEAVTPLSPIDWRLIFDGTSVSLEPSIGNWSFPCQSHYWIRHDRAVWARRWSRSEIDAVRAKDQTVKRARYSRASLPRIDDLSPRDDQGSSRVWNAFKRWLGGAGA